jgi:hypothetical protein
LTQINADIESVPIWATRSRAKTVAALVVIIIIVLLAGIYSHRPDWKRVVYAAMPSVRRLRVVRGALARSSRFAGFGKRTSHALASRDLQ